MFADVLPPPTYVSDWHMIGWPASVIVPCALAASLIAMVVGLARHQRPVRNLVLVLGAIILFLVADYVVYEIGVRHQDLWRKRVLPPLQPDRPSE